MSVERVRLAAVLELADADVSVDPGSRYPLLGILGHGRGLLLRETIQGSDTSYKTLRRMALDQVVYSRLKAFEGAFAVVSKDGDGRYASSEFPNFDVDHSRVSVEWLGHVLHTGWFGARVGELSQGIGARRERLGVDQFLSIEIPLPDLDTQREIASRLDSMSRVAASVDLAARTDLARARERRVLQLIDGAPERAIGEVVDLNRVKVTITDIDNYRPIGVRSFGRGLIEYPETDSSGLSKLAYFKVPPDALVLSNIKAWEGAVTHYSGGKDLVTSSRFLCYTAKRSDVLTEFLAEVLKTTEGTTKLAAASPGSADRNRTLGRQRFEQIRVPVPAIDVQRSVLGETARFDDLEQAYSHRQRLVAALLPAARNEEFRKLLAN